MKKAILFIGIILSLSFSAWSAEPQKEKLNIGETVMEHITDSHSSHILSYKNTNVAIPLPVILINNGKIDIFMSSRFEEGEAAYKGYKLGSEKDGANLKNKIICVDSAGKYTGQKPIDLSITKNVRTLFFVAIILLFLVFLARSIALKRRGKAFTGTQTVMEYVIMFIRDDIAEPSLGKKRYEKYMPYLLTVFCFIFLANLLGLIPFFPGGANLTGNIAVTMTLALITFVITSFSGTKSYWKHIINMPGVPIWLKCPAPIMPIVETLGVFTKPFALTVRLFANITAGHIIILGFISIIFIFGNISAVVGYCVSPLSLLFGVFMSLVELLVAFIQAYVFTLLSAIYIGMAHEEEVETEAK